MALPHRLSPPNYLGEVPPGDPGPVPEARLLRLLPMLTHRLAHRALHGHKQRLSLSPHFIAKHTSTSHPDRIRAKRPSTLETRLGPDGDDAARESFRAVLQRNSINARNGPPERTCATRPSTGSSTLATVDAAASAACAGSPCSSLS